MIDYSEFDRERFESGEMPTRTRGGWKVLKVFDTKFDYECGEQVKFPLVAFVREHHGADILIRAYTRDGKLWGYQDSDLDLVYEKKTRTVEVVLFNFFGKIRSVTEDQFLSREDYDKFVQHKKESGMYHDSFLTEIGVSDD